MLELVLTDRIHNAVLLGAEDTDVRGRDSIGEAIPRTRITNVIKDVAIVFDCQDSSNNGQIDTKTGR